MISINKPFISDLDKKYIIECFEENFLSGDGPDCRMFEQEFSNYVECKHSLFISSATAGLDLSFKCLDIPPRSTVLVPDYTFTSSALGPLMNGFNIKLIDVCPDTGLVTPEELAKYENDKNIKAIVIVDYAGCTPDLDEIIAVCKNNGWKIVHDTAQSIGTKYKNKLTGNFGEFSTFSFHGTKNMTTGEGGIITFSSDEYLEKIKVLRDKGTNKSQFNFNQLGYYRYEEIGNSYVQSNLLAALGRSQLKQIGFINERRDQIAKIYYDEFKSLEFKLAPNPSYLTKNNHIFYLLAPKGKRDLVINFLRGNGVGANIHYHPLHLNPLYAQFQGDSKFEGSVEFYDRLIRIPIYPSLSEEEIEYVVEQVIKSSRQL